MACLNRIAMNIIKAKCIGNKNLYYLGCTQTYKDYVDDIELNMYDVSEKDMLNEEEYFFVKTWSTKKPRLKKVEVDKNE